MDHWYFTMDKHEGVPGGHYRRKAVRVRCDPCGDLEAVAYVAGDSFVDDSLVPTGEYLQTILQGARNHQLPEEYIRQIERAANRDERHTLERQGPA